MLMALAKLSLPSADSPFSSRSLVHIIISSRMAATGKNSFILRGSVFMNFDISAFAICVA